MTTGVIEVAGTAASVLTGVTGETFGAARFFFCLITTGAGASTGFWVKFTSHDKKLYKK